MWKFIVFNRTKRKVNEILLEGTSLFLKGIYLFPRLKGKTEKGRRKMSVVNYLLRKGRGKTVKGNGIIAGNNYLFEKGR